MMPWWHFAISLLVSYILISYLSLDVTTGIKWIIVGCIAGTFIDLDHFLYAYLAYKKKAKQIILRGIEDPQGLMEEFREKGILHYHASRRLILHAVIMLSVYSISLYAFPSYSLVIGINFLVHLVCDLEPRWLKY